MWQDWVLTVGQLILTAALLPTLFGKSKPAVSTSLLTGSTLFVFGLVYLSLSFWFTTITAFLTAIIWFVLAVQKYFVKK